MNYMGSKRKYAGEIVPIINKYIKDNGITQFYDIMCGGANLVDKIVCNETYGNDLSPTLIALHIQAQEDFSKIPKQGSREYWDKGYSEYKKFLQGQTDIDMPLYEIGAIEWYSSFARGGFPRGYAKPTTTRDYFKEGRKAHYEQSLKEKYKKIKFSCEDYRNLEIPAGALIYVDPPYKGTKPYGISPKFNHEELFNWIREKSKTSPIFLSEQKAPDDFEIVWSKDGVIRTAALHNDYVACEKLFLIDNREDK